MPNPLAIYQDTSNPLAAGTPTLADAADWHRQNLADAWASARDPQTWQDAARQYGNALLGGSIAPEAKGLKLDAAAMQVLREMTPGGRMAAGPVDVASLKTGLGEPVTAHVNPSRSDIARMLEATTNLHLRALQEGPNHAIWPALDATHGQMAAPLGFTKDAVLLDYRGRVGEPDADFPQKAGRFSFWAASH